MTVHDTLTLRTGGNLAVAIRKNSPKLAAELNGFIAKNGLESAIGQILSKRYLREHAVREERRPRRRSGRSSWRWWSCSGSTATSTSSTTC